VWTTVILTVVASACALGPLLVDRVIGAREILSGLPRSMDATWMFARALWPAAVLVAMTAIVVNVARPHVALRMLIMTGALMPTLLIAGAHPLLTQAYPWQRLGSVLRETRLVSRSARPLADVLR
jgi:hypothetical protein